MVIDRDTIKIKIKVPRKEIVFIDMVFKSYEGLAAVAVDELDKGTLVLDVTEGTHDDVLKILGDLQERIPLTIIDDGKKDD